jgi:hypothetical protein
VQGIPLNKYSTDINFGYIKLISLKTDLQETNAQIYIWFKIKRNSCETL